MKVLSLFLLLLTVIQHTASQPLPDYQQQTTWTHNLQLNYTVKISPDSNSMVYYWPQHFEASKQFFIFVPFMFQQKKIKINLTEQVRSIEFDPKGERVYVVSEGVKDSKPAFNVIYYQVSQGVIDLTPNAFCQSTLPTFPFQFLLSITENRIAVKVDTRVYIFLMSADKKTAQFESRIQRPKYYVQDIEWHPINRQMLFVTSDQFITYNCTSKSSSIIDKDYFSMGFLLNGEVIAIGNSNANIIDFYQYRNGALSLINGLNVVNFMIRAQLISTKNNIFIANYPYDYPDEKIQIYELIKQPNDGSFRLKLISQKILTQRRALSISSDGNQYYTYTFNITMREFQQQIRCGNNTYLSGQSCQNCSAQCKTCHFSPTQCTSCANSVIGYEKCVDCADKYLGCSKCNQTDCVQCQAQNNFSPQPSGDNKCYCIYKTFLPDGAKKCQYCSQYMKGCQSCNNSKACQYCDYSNNYTLNTSNLCECKPNYFERAIYYGCQPCVWIISYCQKCSSSQNNTYCDKCQSPYYLTPDHKSCLNCPYFGRGCIQCTKSTCTACDTSRNYNSTINRTDCVCNYGFTEINGTCLPCQTIGCSKCNTTTKCNSCFVQKNFIQSPNNGSCMCKNQTLLDEKAQRCYYCSERMMGCVNCTTLKQCLACNTSARFKLNTEASLCQCESDTFLFQNSCKFCNEIYPGCTSCSQVRGQAATCFKCKEGYQFYFNFTQPCVCNLEIQDDQTCKPKSYMLYYILTAAGIGLVAGFLGAFVYFRLKKRSISRQPLLSEVLQGVSTQNNNKKGVSQSLLSG